MLQDFELFRLIDISDDSEYHVDADIPRMHERTYTYKIGELYGLDVLVDVYAATNKNGDVIVYNETSGSAYTREQESPNFNLEDEGFVNLRKSLETALESDAEERFRNELGLLKPETTLENALNRAYFSDSEVLEALKDLLKKAEHDAKDEPESVTALKRVYALRKIISQQEKKHERTERV